MSPNKHCICIGILVHRSLQTTSEVLLKGSVIDDWNTQGVMISVVALSTAFWNTLDLLNVVDLKACIGALLALDQQGDEHCPLGVCMDTASSAMFERCQEKWSAVGGFQLQRLANVIAFCGRVLCSRPLDDEDVFWFDQFLLNTGRGEKDMFTLADGCL